MSNCVGVRPAPSPRPLWVGAGLCLLAAIVGVAVMVMMLVSRTGSESTVALAGIAVFLGCTIGAVFAGYAWLRRRDQSIARRLADAGFKVTAHPGREDGLRFAAEVDGFNLCERVKERRGWRTRADVVRWQAHAEFEGREINAFERFVSQYLPIGLIAFKQDTFTYAAVQCPHEWPACAVVRRAHDELLPPGPSVTIVNAPSSADWTVISEAAQFASRFLTPEVQDLLAAARHDPSSCFICGGWLYVVAPSRVPPGRIAEFCSRPSRILERVAPDLLHGIGALQ